MIYEMGSGHMCMDWEWRKKSVKILTYDKVAYFGIQSLAFRRLKFLLIEWVSMSLKLFPGPCSLIWSHIFCLFIT
jgi:hypothetical protein